MERDENTARDLALLAARWIVGASLIGHGTQKLFGWFNGPGLEGATYYFKQLGFEPPDQHVRAAALSEIAGGTLIAAGAFGPVGPALLAGVMTTAAGSVHVKNGYWASNQGFELNMMYALLGLVFAADDYGRFSVDHALGVRGKLPSPLSLLAVAGGIGAGIAMLSRRNIATESSNGETQSQTVQTERGEIDAALENATAD
jgi:putative oxidoreductase